MLTLGLSIGFVVVPTMIVLFFHGATAGIFGNSTGGIKGALLGGFIISTIVALWAAGIHQVSGTSHYPGYYYVGGRDR